MLQPLVTSHSQKELSIHNCFRLFPSNPDWSQRQELHISTIVKLQRQESQTSFLWKRRQEHTSIIDLACVSASQRVIFPKDFRRVPVKHLKMRIEIGSRTARTARTARTRTSINPSTRCLRLAGLLRNAHRCLRMTETMLQGNEADDRGKKPGGASHKR